MCDNTNDCTCNECTPTCYDTSGCLEVIGSDCVKYTGDVIPAGETQINPGDLLTEVIEKLAANGFDFTLGATFNTTTRVLSLQKNGVTAATVSIPENDYYLVVSGTKLQLFRDVPGPTDLKLSEVELSSLLSETALAVQSTSLDVTQSGTKGHNVTINVSPSADAGNSLVLGSDGKPYVPKTPKYISYVEIENTDCITFTKTLVNGTLTIVPTIDWACVAAQVCPICNQSCDAPGGLIVEIIG